MMKEKNGGQICLFKISKAGHNIASENVDEFFVKMTGFLDGELNEVWEPTRRGDFQWHGEKPKKGYVHPDKW